MAYDFDGSTDYLYFSSFTDITDVPHSGSIWFRTDSNTADQALWRLGPTTSGAPQYRNQYMGAGTDIMRFDVNGSPGGIDVDTTNSISDTTSWHHYGCMTKESTDLHQSILDGDWANRGESTTNKNVNAGINQLSIGCNLYSGSPSTQFNGVLAEFALWNTQLVQADFEALAAGYSPLFIKPQNLLLYMPMVSDDRDIIGNRTATSGGTPTVTAEHPPMIYPERQEIIRANETTSFQESAIVAGGKHFRLTVSGDTWIK